MDNRGVSTVVEKTLAVGLVVLYVGLVSATVYGGVVPAYRTEAGAELGERTLSVATQRVQQAVPPNATAVDARVRVDLPDTIRGTAYGIGTENRTLVLEHPRRGIDGRAPLALPPPVVGVEGRWESDATAYVRVHSVPGGLVVRLENT